jgi:hypothetical protein
MDAASAVSPSVLSIAASGLLRRVARFRISMASRNCARPGRQLGRHFRGPIAKFPWRHGCAIAHRSNFAPHQSSKFRAFILGQSAVSRSRCAISVISPWRSISLATA